MQFKAEAEEDVLKRKLDAKRIPLVALDEEARESAVPDFYPPNWALDIPKRPSWDYSTSKNELEQAEKKYFDEYLLSLHSLPGIERLSHFEHNLEVCSSLIFLCTVACFSPFSCPRVILRGISSLLDVETTLESVGAIKCCVFHCGCPFCCRSIFPTPIVTMATMYSVLPL